MHMQRLDEQSLAEIHPSPDNLLYKVSAVQQQAVVSMYFKSVAAAHHAVGVWVT